MVPPALLDVAAAIPARVGPDLTRYVLVCSALFLALGGLAWILRRAVAGSVRARAGKRSLQVVDVLPLGGKQRVCVVRCYDRTFALGVGEKEIGLIAEIDAAVSVAAHEETPVPFQSVLSRLRGAARSERAEVPA
ncbi:MAG: flagellar biosynthetic protein FliO [Planctomycetes bacterium]|nr:flagellar biosynthetic protein FliO [Planctomycetota bacterium]